MEDILITILSGLKYPVYRQGSLSEGEAYPETFFTFWNNQEIEHSPYDDDTVIVEYGFSVYVYSTDPAKAYELLDTARAQLRASGWIINTRAFDAPSDEVTHVGRGMMISFLKTLIQEVQNNG